MPNTLRRAAALLMMLCLIMLPLLAQAETYLPQGDVTHVDFTAAVAVHADGFPASKAHLADWEKFLAKLDLKGSMEVLAALTPHSRVYLEGALRLNGREQIPFVYDGYHSYRYFITPALGNEVFYFQMHNFLEFMLKPYYYMELPTQYLALLLYPQASYAMGESYYTPVAELLASARQAALDAAAAEPATLTYTVPYQHLYELCETLDLIVNDDPELERAYFYFTCLLTELYASDMALDILGRLEDVLDYLDPEQQGMLVRETPTGLTCTLGDTLVFEKGEEAGTAYVRFCLPTPEGFDFAAEYSWDGTGIGATLKASAGILMEGKPFIQLTTEGEGLPREGDVGGQGHITFAATGSGIQAETTPVTFGFEWARDSATLPYTLGLTLDWLHPQTEKPAVSVEFTGTFTASDKGVFVDAAYPQNDFFNLNESFLNEYKARLMTPLLLKLMPIALETPAGVINDLYAFTTEHDILVSLVE